MGCRKETKKKTATDKQEVTVPIIDRTKFVH